MPRPYLQGAITKDIHRDLLRKKGTGSIKEFHEKLTRLFKEKKYIDLGYQNILHGTKRMNKSLFSEFLTDNYHDISNASVTTNMQLAALVNLPFWWAFRTIYKKDPIKLEDLGEKELNRIELTQNLMGNWEINYLEDRTFKIAYLLLEVDRYKEYDFYATIGLKYEAETFILRGNGSIFKKALELRFCDGDRLVYLAIQLDELTEFKEQKNIILNATGVSHGFDKTISTRLLLERKNTFEEVFDVLRVEQRDLHRLTRNYSPAEYMSTYLSKYPAQKLRPFRRDKPVDYWAEHYQKEQGKSGYQFIEDILEKSNEDGWNWYSFSRIDYMLNQIEVFRWDFQFDPTGSNVNAKRFKINNSGIDRYNGIVLFESDHLYFLMRSQLGGYSKRNSVIAEITDKKRKSIHGISAMTFQNKDVSNKKLNKLDNMAAREIFYYLPDKLLTLEEYPSLGEGYLSNDDFMSLEHIDHLDKLLLSNWKYGTLSYPKVDNHHFHLMRLNEASEYAGKYCMFIGVMYKRERHILQTFFTIDALSNVTIEVNYPWNGKEETFQGHLEKYANHLVSDLEVKSLKSEDHKVSRMVFDRAHKSEVNDYYVFSGRSIDPSIFAVDEPSYPFLIVNLFNVIGIDFKTPLTLHPDDIITKTLLDNFRYKFSDIEDLKAYFGL